MVLAARSSQSSPGAEASRRAATSVSVEPVKSVPVVLEFFVEALGVDQVAVVGEGQRAVRAFDVDRLGVLLLAGAGGGVAGVADGDVAGEVAEVVLIEDLGDEAHARADVESWSVSGGDSGAFLAAVLECVDAVEGGAGYVLARGVHPEDAAFVLPDGARQWLDSHTQRNGNSLKQRSWHLNGLRVRPVPEY